MYKFWDEAFAFLKDGNHPIDNNIAERVIRLLTMQCNSMLHFGSDEVCRNGGCISWCNQHCETAREWVWDYLGEFFKNIFNGCKDFVNLIPQNIELVCASS